MLSLAVMHSEEGEDEPPLLPEFKHLIILTEVHAFQMLIYSVDIIS
jgi:hypothetical protein